MSSRDTHEEPALISGKYQILGLAGRGGTGMVYKVRHLALDTVFALKVLPAEWRDNTEIVRRFHQEARVMARFNHPNIVRVSDVDKDGSTPYFVMEYVEGRSLSEYLADCGPLSLQEALEITRQVALALDYAHSHPSAVVHRDIKPQNILIENSSRRAVVTDFGIAKVRGASMRTSVDLMLGTLLYCAPEQILPTGSIDGRADLYSLGLVLYEMVTRRAFFGDLDERTLVGKILSAEENVPSFPAPVPAEFAALVRRAIARNPEARYQSAKDLLKDIETCLAFPSASLETQVATLPPPVAANTAVTVHLQRNALGSSEEPPPLSSALPSEKWRRAVVPVGGALLVGVVSLVWALMSGQTDPVSATKQETDTVVAGAPVLDLTVVPPASLSEDTNKTTSDPPLPSPSLSPPTDPIGAEEPALPTQTASTPPPPPSDLPVTSEQEQEPEVEQSLPVEDAVSDDPFPAPRRFRITTRTAVRESPTWASKEAVWLQPGARVYAVAQVGDWLKVESRAQPPKPPGFVWKADARGE